MLNARQTIIAVGMLICIPAISPSIVWAGPKATSTLDLPAGTTIKRLNDGAIALRNRGGITGTYSCRCSGSKGSCSVVQTEGVLECGKSTDSCNGSCDMSTTTGGGKLKLQMQ